jgi:hypothetical protein
MSYDKFNALKRTNKRVYDKFYYCRVSKYKLFLNQCIINNSHYHSNTQCLFSKTNV